MLDLIRRVALAQGIENQTDWAAWYREKTGQEPDYSALLEELASSPEERRSILHSYIEPTEEDREEGRKIPTAAHHAIADLVRGGYIRVIVTTNFDRLMENALPERYRADGHRFCRCAGGRGADHPYRLLHSQVPRRL